MSLRALFVTYGGGHIAMVLPVIRALRRKMPDVQVDLIALTTARKAAEAAGEPARGFADFVQLADPAFVAEWGARLAPAESHPAVSREETLAYTGVNFWDLVRQYGMERAHALYDEKGRYGFYPIHFFRRVLAHLRPDVVVATNSPRSEHAALNAAIECGVPTLSMIDLFAMHYDPYLKRGQHADRITVMLPQVRDNLAAAGIDPARVVVTGNPAFDGLLGAELRESARRLRAHLGWQDFQVVLWAGIVERLPSSEGIPAGTEFGRRVEAELRRWCAAEANRGLIVRYHPNESHLFEPMLPAARVHVAKPLAEPIHPQILCADAVVVTGSTVGVETAAAGVPVLSMESSGSSGELSYASLGISHGVPRIAALPEVLDRVLSQGSTAGGQVQRAPAAPLIADEILSLMQGRPAVPR